VASPNCHAWAMALTASSKLDVSLPSRDSKCACHKRERHLGIRAVGVPLRQSSNLMRPVDSSSCSTRPAVRSEVFLQRTLPMDHPTWRVSKVQDQMAGRQRDEPLQQWVVMVCLSQTPQVVDVVAKMQHWQSWVPACESEDVAQVEPSRMQKSCLSEQKHVPLHAT